jgi:hypothetical protein
MPAQFWEFEVETDEDYKCVIETGSGFLSDYWGSVLKVAEGCFIVNGTPSLPDIRNKLSPISNLIAMLESSEFVYHHEAEVHKMIAIEIEQCKKSIAYLSGNGA